MFPALDQLRRPGQYLGRAEVPVLQREPEPGIFRCQCRGPVIFLLAEIRQADYQASACYDPA
jgi:hypothetical protein